MAIPVTLADARRQLRLEQDDASRDTELNQFIADAAAWVERYTGHILVARDVTESFPGFGPVMLRAWPIKPEAAASVVYADTAGAPIALTGATLDVRRRPARIVAGGRPSWVVTGRQSFTVTIRAGYEPADPVPGNLRRAMLVLIAAYDEDREGGELFQTAEATARRLCSDLRTRTL